MFGSDERIEQIGSFGDMLWFLHCVGLCVQISAHVEVDQRVSGNALFTEVPHDIISQAGEDVEMACSFRGAGVSSVSLEIQWWYTRHGRDWPQTPGWTTNQVQEETSKRETKISVVKVVGSNISHKLRLSSVKPSDEGTYECRVTDFSESQAQQHRVQAYLQVQPEDLLHQEHTPLQSEGPLHHMHQETHHTDHHTSTDNHQLKAGEEKHKSQQKPGHEEHRKSHHKKAEELRTQEVVHRLHEVDHQQLHNGNRTTGNKRAENLRHVPHTLPETVLMKTVHARGEQREEEGSRGGDEREEERT